MEYAIIQNGGKQYKVIEGMTLDLDSLGRTEGEVDFDKVLLFVTEGKTNIGMPFISGFSVKAKILGSKKGEKLRVSKFKAKSKYRRSMGYRHSLTTVEILPFGKTEKVEKKPSAKKVEKKV